MMRILLFLGTNLAVLLVLGAVLSLLEPWMIEQGINVNQAGILIIAVVLGMGGALISLALSKTMAIRSTGAHVIKEPRNETEQWLLSTVKGQAERAGIGMPDVAIYDSADMNAFATGMSRNNALVAVSTGLLRGMRRGEVEAVLGHEVSHVANGDMVTLTLIQGVLNTLVILFARIIGQLIDRVVFRNERGHGIGYFVAVIVAQLVLGLLASMVVMAFSRRREFRADAGGAALAGTGNMTAALQRLGQQSEQADLPEAVEAFGISGGVGAGIKRLLMSHPPIDERIQALQERRSQEI